MHEFKSPLYHVGVSLTQLFLPESLGKKGIMVPNSLDCY